MAAKEQAHRPDHVTLRAPVYTWVGEAETGGRRQHPSLNGMLG